MLDASCPRPTPGIIYTRSATVRRRHSFQLPTQPTSQTTPRLYRHFVVDSSLPNRFRLDARVVIRPFVRPPRKRGSPMRFLPHLIARWRGTRPWVHCVDAYAQ
jgi:hypothetical protein